MTSKKDKPLYEKGVGMFRTNIQNMMHFEAERENFVENPKFAYLISRAVEGQVVTYDPSKSIFSSKEQVEGNSSDTT